MDLYELSKPFVSHFLLNIEKQMIDIGMSSSKDMWRKLCVACQAGQLLEPKFDRSESGE